MPTTIHGTNGITFNDGSTQNTRPAVGFRNRIINGDCRIDQRNAGASLVTTTDYNGYTIDRFYLAQNGVVRSTVGRSEVVPTGQGFTNSFLTTITTADAAVATGNKTMGYYYKLEGYNVSDFGWGTASAQTITISFWVRSSVAGTYSFTVTNTNFARNYNTSYTINAANTWEKKTFTIAGDTGATSIDTTNGHAIGLVFDLGYSTLYEGSTANTWLATSALALSGCTKLAATAGATWYLTGLQLEAGSTATEFERRPIGTELALCQRYYYRQTKTSGASGVASAFAMLQLWSNAWHSLIQFPVTMRSAPSFESSSAATFFYHAGGVGNSALTSINISGSNGDSARLEGGTTYSATQGLAGQLAMANSSTAFLGFSSEL